MPSLLTLGARSASSGALRTNLWLKVPVRPASVPVRQVCRPVLLAPGPRSPRRQRARLVARNFKQSSDSPEEAHVTRPKPVRHPLTEDPFAGASSAETATQEVLFNAGSTASASAAKPQTVRTGVFLWSKAKRVAYLLTHPRALRRTLLQNDDLHKLPLLLVAAVFALQQLPSFWSFYCSSLSSYPLPTKVATGVVGSILGDYIAQKLSHRTEVELAEQRGEPAPPFVFDVLRTSRLTIYGAIVGTPIGHAWFQLLDTHIMPEAMTSIQAVFIKTAMDQLLMCPASTALFFVVMRCWEGHTDDAIAYMCGKMLPTLQANYLLWPIAHVVNFALVPPAQRILYCNAVGVVWTVILSTIANSKAPPVTPSGSAASGNRGPGPIMTGGAGAGASWSGNPALGGAVLDMPRHAHAAFTTGFASQDATGCSVGQYPPLKGRKSAMQPGVPSTAYMRWEALRKDC